MQKRNTDPTSIYAEMPDGEMLEFTAKCITWDPSDARIMELEAENAKLRLQAALAQPK